LDIVAQDIGVIEGADVYPVMDGVVKFSYKSDTGGKAVIIDHQNGFYDDVMQVFSLWPPFFFALILYFILRQMRL